MKNYYIYHKVSKIYGTAFLCTLQHVAIRWEIGIISLHVLPDANIQFVEAGNDITQPALHNALPQAIPLMQAEFPPAKVGGK